MNIVDVEAVIALTKVSGETNLEYYKKVAANKTAWFVKKYGDIPDNYNRTLAMPEGETRDRLMKKYELGLSIL